MLSHQIRRRRRFKNMLALSMSAFSMLIALFWLGWILFTIIKLGLSGISIALFTEMTPPPGVNGGGLCNAIIGSLILVVISTSIAMPIGVMAGIYLVEYALANRLASFIRFVNDLMLSTPSIVIGLFVYALVVVRMGNFSALAGACALALIQIPIIIRSTENMLKLVPNTLREAAFALGIPKWRVIVSITLKASYGGILTGLLLSIARVAGETAPLLFTVLSNQFFNLSLTHPMANLPVTIFQFAMSPFEHWQSLAWAGVLLITVTVLLLTIIARFFVKSNKPY